MKSQPFAARPRSTERASCLYARVQVDGAESDGLLSKTNFNFFLEKKYLKQTVWFSEVDVSHDAQALHAHDARVSRDSLAGIGVSSSLRFR